MFQWFKTATIHLFSTPCVGTIGRVQLGWLISAPVVFRRAH